MLQRAIHRAVRRAQTAKTTNVATTRWISTTRTLRDGQTTVAAVLSAMPDGNSPTVDHLMTTERAAQLMAKMHLDAVPVVKDNKIIGMFTEHDYFDKVLNANHSAVQTSKVCEVATMGARLIVAYPDDTVAGCLEVMFKKNLSAIPVVEQDGHVMGTVTMRDLTKEMLVKNGQDKVDTGGLKKIDTNVQEKAADTFGQAKDTVKAKLSSFFSGQDKSDTLEQAKAAGSNVQEKAADKYEQAKAAGSNAKEKAADKYEQAKAAGSNVQEKAADKYEQAKAAGSNVQEKAADKYEQAKAAGSNVQEKAFDMQDKAFDMQEKAADKLEQTKADMKAKLSSYFPESISAAGGSYHDEFTAETTSAERLKEIYSDLKHDLEVKLKEEAERPSFDAAAAERFHLDPNLNEMAVNSFSEASTFPEFTPSEDGLFTQTHGVPPTKEAIKEIAQNWEAQEVPMTLAQGELLDAMPTFSEPSDFPEGAVVDEAIVSQKRTLRSD